MTANEAHQYTLGIVDELHRSGIPVEIRPWKTKDREFEAECIAKYGGPERASRDRWCHVTLKPSSVDQKDLVQRKSRELGWMGISFDTGGCGCGRDWELDWSFKYIGQFVGGKEEEARDFCERFIRDFIEPQSICPRKVKQTEN